MHFTKETTVCLYIGVRIFEFRQKIDIELNGTVMVIGEIVEVMVDENLIQDDGKLAIVKAQSVAVTGLDEYHVASSLGRLAYAKPK